MRIVKRGQKVVSVSAEEHRRLHQRMDTLLPGGKHWHVGPPRRTGHPILRPKKRSRRRSSLTWAKLVNKELNKRR